MYPGPSTVNRVPNSYVSRPPHRQREVSSKIVCPEAQPEEAEKIGSTAYEFPEAGSVGNAEDPAWTTPPPFGSVVNTWQGPPVQEPVAPGGKAIFTWAPFIVA